MHALSSSFIRIFIVRPRETYNYNAVGLTFMILQTSLAFTKFLPFSFSNTSRLWRRNPIWNLRSHVHDYPQKIINHFLP